jgi:hypothetical protein
VLSNIGFPVPDFFAHILNDFFFIDILGDRRLCFRLNNNGGNLSEGVLGSEKGGKRGNVDGMTLYD